MHPDILLDKLTINQLLEWEAYDKIDPIGKWREDFHMSYLATLITNIARAVHAKKGTQMTEIEDHMPAWGVSEEDKPVKKQTVTEMKEILLGIAREQNLKDKREKMNLDRPPKSLRDKNG